MKVSLRFDRPGGWAPPTSRVSSRGRLCGAGSIPVVRVVCGVGLQEQDLAGKTVVVVGLGLSGRSAALLAAERGAKVIGVDSRTTITTLESDERFAAVKDQVSTELGEHNRSTFLTADRLVLSPGVPLTQADVAAALSVDVPTTSELGFAAEALPDSIPVAAVTGTNGKSTVTTFTGQLLEAAGVPTFMGGNLGVPLSDAVLDLRGAARGDGPAGFPGYGAAVVEVSSYQLELPGELKPRAAVILNLTPDHMERHKTMECYGETKCRLFGAMGDDGVAVLPAGDAFLEGLAAKVGGGGRRAWLGDLPGAVVEREEGGPGRVARVQLPGADEVDEVDLGPLRAVGRHNEENAAAASLLALALRLDGVTPSALSLGVSALAPPAHRMEVVGSEPPPRNVLWVDDSKATNIEATLVGVDGMDRPSVVLLGGEAKLGVGADGGLGFQALAPALARHRAVVVFGASRAGIAEELRAEGVGFVLAEGGLVGAVEVARGLAEPGDAILLSPACASFDEFNNFMERGRKFASLFPGAA